MVALPVVERLRVVMAVLPGVEHRPVVTVVPPAAVVSVGRLEEPRREVSVDRPAAVVSVGRPAVVSVLRPVAVSAPQEVVSRLRAAP